MVKIMTTVSPEAKAAVMPYPDRIFPGRLWVLNLLASL
jgi:hypothetical protein